MYYYNKFHGLSNYMDPFARLFCVKYDWSPIMGNYWKPNDDLSEEQLDSLRRDGAGFTKAIQGLKISENSSSIVGSEYYRLGERMKSEVNIAAEGDTDKYVSQYLDVFPIPYPNLYGECNNFHAGRFMESESAECA